MRTNILTAALILGALASVQAAADVPPAPAEGAPAKSRPNMLSLGIGLNAPLSTIDLHSIGGGSAANGDPGVAVGVQYLRSLTPRVGAGFGIDYLTRSGTTSERLLPTARSSVSGDTLLLLGMVRCSLTDGGSPRPFILAGVGGHRTTTTIDARAHVESPWPDTLTHETRRLVDDAAWGPAASLRAGLDIDIDPREPGVLTIEAGWTWLDSVRYEAAPQGQARGLSRVSGPLTQFTLTARYGWRF